MDAWPPSSPFNNRYTNPSPLDVSSRRRIHALPKILYLTLAADVVWIRYHDQLPRNVCQVSAPDYAATVALIP
jgi:hypothetical protein